MKDKKQLTLTALAGFALASGTQAATLIISSFDLTPSNVVDTTGAADWGYFTDVNGLDDATAGIAFESLTTGGNSATVRKSPSDIGAVTFTETDDFSSTNPVNAFDYTFDGNAANLTAGSVAPSEELFSLKLNDLGTGTHTFTFYGSHSNTKRQFDIDYSVFEDDDAETSATLSATGENSGDLVNNRATYTLEFDTTTANTDLLINVGSAGSGIGSFGLGGYTLTTVVPEPSSFALLAGCFGLTWIMVRRR